jgi:EAL domain-containing protein (putative c-di-GMP-specific phosphodiesterase class I)
VMSVYVYSKLTMGRLISKKVALLMAIPMVSGWGVVLFGEVSYARNAAGSYYSLGSAIYYCYFIGFLYIFATLIGVIIFRGRMNKEESRSVLVGLLIWAVLAFFQFVNHGFQVSSIAMMLMGLVLFLSIENPKEYYEKSVNSVLNRDACILMLAERFAAKKGFFILSVIFTGKTNVLTGTDREQLNELQGKISELAAYQIDAVAYASYWNTLSFVVNTPEKVEKFMNLVNNFDDTGGIYKITFSVLEVPKCTDDLDRAVQILDYVSSDYVFTQSSPNLVIDQDVVDKMIYRNSIEDIVRQAVKSKAFDVYYQPILCVKDGAFSSAEALVRLRRPNTENYISPEDFIPIAEKCGLVQEIDDLVFEKVCSFIARENLTSYGIKVVEVNLSVNEVVDPQTHDRLRHKMEKYHIPPKFINFEITETSYINNDLIFKDNVKKLQELGSTFSMDDFGSGYSNILEILKMDYFLVKMDKEFVWNCLDKERPENMRMMDYTINFLKDFGLHILAEGVETLDQAKILIDKGVEYLQGFYYSRPIPEDEYSEFLKAQKGLFANKM